MEPSPPSSPTSLVVSSPRRTLSLLRERRAKASAAEPPRDSHEKVALPAEAASRAFAEERGPKPSEVYGFVGSITTVIATAVFLVWAYTPEPWLHSMGITYYPSKYWAIAVPSFAMVSIILTLTFYLGLNFMATPASTSFNTMFDEHSRDRSMLTSSSDIDEQPIEPISDIGIDQINKLMFG